MSDEPDAAGGGPRTNAELRAFVRENTRPLPVPLVPEILVRQSADPMPLWHATEAWLAHRGIEPPFWAFPWAGGQVLARYLLDSPSVVARRRVLDFACGGGLVGLAAAKAGAAHVTAIDTDRLAAVAAAMNAEGAGVGLAIEVGDWVGRAVDADVVLAGDVFYDARAAARFLPWFRELAARGALVLVGDPGRTYAPRDAVEVRFEADVPVPEGLEGKPSLRARVLAIGAG